MEDTFKVPLPVVKKPKTNDNEDKGQVKPDPTPDKDDKKDDAQAATVALPEPMTDQQPAAGQFYIEVLKSGCVIEKLSLTKNRLIFGRVDDCDVTMYHPSVSRYHAALLWSTPNIGNQQQSFWYLVDCGSTHGTWLNKNQLEPGKYNKVDPNNNVFKFGVSTRIFMLCSSDGQEEADSPGDEEAEFKVPQKTKQQEEDTGCNWGFGEDAAEVETEDVQQSLKAILLALKEGQIKSTDNENVYQANPLKTLQQWFEREGYQMEYRIDEIHGKYKCVVDLPVDGQWVAVEGTPTPRKKESVIDASLKCCQVLDRAHQLFPWQQQQAAAMRRRKRNEDSDSDPEDMIDETGVNERRKAKRQELAAKTLDQQPTAETVESLNEKWTATQQELGQLKVRLALLSEEKRQEKDEADEEGDALDNFMASMKTKKFGLSISDKIEKSKMKMKIGQLEKEQARLEKLIRLAKPAFQLPAVEAAAEEPVRVEASKLVQEKKQEEEAEEETLPMDLSQHREHQDQPQDEEMKQESDEKPSTEFVRLKSILKSPKVRPLEPATKETRKPQESHPKSLAAIVKKEQQQQELKKSLVEGDFVDWLPPTGQSGDGKTHLNDKFGY